MRLRGEETRRGAMGNLRWAWAWAVFGGCRGILNLGRAVPELVWALAFVVMVGLGPFAGVLALTAHSAGVLGKLYAELLESVDQRPVEAVRSTGASESQVTLLARIPMALPVLISYTLFRWECNLRSATVLGLVGAGGIGTELVLSFKLYQYHELLTLVAAILLMVAAIDVFGQIIRARILEGSHGHELADG
jgi:phosphonate transport system permease protein